MPYFRVERLLHSLIILIGWVFWFQVSASITNFLHKMCVFLFIGLGCEFSEDYFTDYPLLDAAVKVFTCSQTLTLGFVYLFNLFIIF